MRNWRVLTAIAAVVLALLAGVLVWKYADQQKEDAKKPYQFATVLVAAKRIPANTSFSSALAAGMIKRDQRVHKDLPDTNISGTPNDDQLNSEFKTLVAAHDVQIGETLVAEDFVAQGSSQSGLDGELQSDQAKDKVNQLTAISVTLDDTHAAGGFLVPGDTANVMLTMSTNKDHLCVGNGGGAGSGGGSGSGPNNSVLFTSFLLPGMKVLAVGSTTSAPSTASGSSSSSSSSSSSKNSNSDNSNNSRARSLITFEATSSQAEQIVQAQSCGTLYLSLNPQSFKPGTFKDPGEVVEAINLFGAKPLTKVDAAIQKLNSSR